MAREGRYLTLCLVTSLCCSITARSEPRRGDFNNDGRDDLAIAVPLDDVLVPQPVGGALLIEAAGAVNVIYGSAAGLSAAGDQLWHQGSPGVLGTPESYDQPGPPAYGDFNGDGFSDLAFGVIQDVVNGVHAGAVNVLYGSNVGLTANGNQRWHQDSQGVNGNAEDDDVFGRRLVAADFNGDGYADLAIGNAVESVDGVQDAGAVNVLYGSFAGLSSAGNQIWHKNTDGISGTATAGDQFGSAFAAGDFD